MRIVGGAWRGRRLASLGRGDANAHLRPTSDRVREALFNILINAHGDPVSGASVLDLFAGTGALALEALSRGAAEAVLVDDGAKSGRLIRENIALCGAGARARLLRRDATRLGPSDQRFDLIFHDPPYGKDLGARALMAARHGGWIADGAIIVWEEAAPMAAPEGFERLDARVYGDTHVTILAA